MEKSRGVFLDRDGVINKPVFRNGMLRAPYELSEFEFLEGVPEAIELLRKARFKIVVVTNQPDVARGWQTREKVELINQHVLDRLKPDAIRACFHDNQDACECRKPKPGMLVQSAAALSIELKNSFMVGDRFTDVDAGKRAGCKTFLVGTDNGETARIEPDYSVSSLLEASRMIVKL